MQSALSNSGLIGFLRLQATANCRLARATAQRKLTVQCECNIGVVLDASRPRLGVAWATNRLNVNDLSVASLLHREVSNTFSRRRGSDRIECHSVRDASPTTSAAAT